MQGRILITLLLCFASLLLVGCSNPDSVVRRTVEDAVGTSAVAIRRN